MHADRNQLRCVECEENGPESAWGKEKEDQEEGEPPEPIEFSPCRGKRHKDGLPRPGSRRGISFRDCFV
jgi:hypothetical protein